MDGTIENQRHYLTLTKKTLDQMIEIHDNISMDIKGITLNHNHEHLTDQSLIKKIMNIPIIEVENAKNIFGHSHPGMKAFVWHEEPNSMIFVELDTYNQPLKWFKKGKKILLIWEPTSVASHQMVVIKKRT